MNLSQLNLTVNPPEPTVSFSLSLSHLLPGIVGALDWLPQVDLPGGLALEALVRRVALPQALDQARSSRDLLQPRVRAFKFTILPDMKESHLNANLLQHLKVPFWDFHCTEIS